MNKAFTQEVEWGFTLAGSIIIEWLHGGVFCGKPSPDHAACIHKPQWRHWLQFWSSKLETVAHTLSNEKNTLETLFSCCNSMIWLFYYLWNITKLIPYNWSGRKPSLFIASPRLATQLIVPMKATLPFTTLKLTKFRSHNPQPRTPRDPCDLLSFFPLRKKSSLCSISTLSLGKKLIAGDSSIWRERIAKSGFKMSLSCRFI